MECERAGGPVGTRKSNGAVAERLRRDRGTFVPCLATPHDRSGELPQALMNMLVPTAMANRPTQRHHGLLLRAFSQEDRDLRSSVRERELHVEPGQ